MKTWIYSWIVYPIGFIFACIVGIFNQKVRRTLRLRFWKPYLSLRYNVGKPIQYWIHVASQGELEYAIPIIQELEKKNKNVLVTYYSISAKSAVESLTKKYSSVSLVVPLPHDGLGLMKEFVRLIKSQGVDKLLLMKYELWPGMLWECKQNEIKIFLVNALKLSWFHKKIFHKLDFIISGYEEEVKDLQYENVVVLGDTRVDRIIDRIQNLKISLNENLSNKLKNLKAFVFGSTWPQDNILLFEALSLINLNEYNINIIWVPHEIDLLEVNMVKKKFQDFGFLVLDWDNLEIEFENAKTSSKIMISVPKKGFLTELYFYSKAAYVGGGFGAGVHSVWEPFLHKKFVACGPKIKRSPEARFLNKNGVLSVIENPRQLKEWLLNDFESDKEKLEKVYQLVLKQNQGASQKIVDFCESV
jgi:3-deoxy-D-manno-octulosonic-acid transferase